MAEPLKIGLAGLGTVGTAVVDLLERGRDKLIARCGRPIEVVVVGARSRSKKRAIDLKKFRWIARPGGARRRSRNRRLRRGHRRRRRSRRRGQTALPPANRSLPPTRRSCGATARNGSRCSAAKFGTKSPLFRGQRRWWHPIVKVLREGLNGDASPASTASSTAPATTSSPDGAGSSGRSPMCLREAQRLGYAEADPSFDVEGRTLRKSSPSWRASRCRTRSTKRRSSSKAYLDRSRSPISTPLPRRYRVKLLGVAVRTEAGIEQRVHPTMVPKEFRDRTGPWCQRGHRRCRRPRPDHPGRARRRRHGDRFRCRFRPCRYRARGAHSPVRPSSRAHEPNPQGADAAP